VQDGAKEYVRSYGPVASGCLCPDVGEREVGGGTCQVLDLQVTHHGKPIVMAMLVHVGPGDAGERALAPFRALATPIADMLRPMSYRRSTRLRTRSTAP
jgi:hypothetical protein